MKDYITIINNIISKNIWLRTNDIINSIVEFEKILTNSNNNILVTSTDDGDGIIVLHCQKAEGTNWTVETIYSPYEEDVVAETYSEYDFYKMGIETLLEGGSVDKYDHQKAEDYIARQKAKAVWEYNVIVLSNGYETVTYYDTFGDGFIFNGNELSYLEAETSLRNTIKDGFTIMFKGYRVENK